MLRVKLILSHALSCVFKVCIGNMDNPDDQKWGFIDNTGKEVTPLKYDSVRDFHEGLAAVQLNDKYGFIDTTGKEVIPIKYDCARDFHEGLAAVWVYGKDAYCSYIDKTGKILIKKYLCLFRGIYLFYIS